MLASRERPVEKARSFSSAYELMDELAARAPDHPYLDEDRGNEIASACQAAQAAEAAKATSEQAEATQQEELLGSMSPSARFLDAQTDQNRKATIHHTESSSEPDKLIQRKRVSYRGVSMLRSWMSAESYSNKNDAQKLVGEHGMRKKAVISHLLKGLLDYVAGALVLANALMMVCELEMEGSAAGVFIGLSEGPRLNDVEPVFRAMDAVFVYLFLLELLFRIYAERRNWIKDMANWFDAFLVLVSLVDMYVLTPLAMANDESQGQGDMVRSLRTLKSLRAIRVLRTFRFFDGLRLFAKACSSLLPSLGWSLVVLGMFICMGALLIGNLLRSFILDDSASLDDRQWIWNRYGTAFRATYTLYEVTFAGNWPTNARPVMEKVSHLFVIFFLVYITIIVFAMIRPMAWHFVAAHLRIWLRFSFPFLFPLSPFRAEDVRGVPALQQHYCRGLISAIFLKDTLDAAQNDAENLVLQRLRKKAEYLQKLEDVFAAIDDSGDGMITEEKLAKVFSNPTAVAYFQTLDIDVSESAALFHILDNGDGEVTHEEFIDGIMRCKGPARAMDQVAMLADLRQLDTKMSKVMRAMQGSGLHLEVGRPTRC
ncbi:Scn11a, partial [Symbiodinium sp. CCMP2456]